MEAAQTSTLETRIGRLSVVAGGPAESHCAEQCPGRLVEVTGDEWCDEWRIPERLRQADIRGSKSTARTTMTGWLTSSMSSSSPKSIAEPTEEQHFKRNRQRCSRGTRLHRQGLQEHLLQFLCKDGAALSSGLRPAALLRQGRVTFSESPLDLQGPDAWLEDHYFGYMVLRPTLAATLGRSLLSPRIRIGARGTAIQSRHKVHSARIYTVGLGLPVDGAACGHRGMRACFVLGHPPALQRAVCAAPRVADA